VLNKGLSRGILGNLTKNQQRKEIMKVADNQSSQSRLDNVYFEFNISKAKAPSKPNKAIIINDIASKVKDEDELDLKIGFSLVPSKASFSKVNLDLFFGGHLLKSTSLEIPQSSLLNDIFEYPQTIIMKGIGAGEYLFRVEMYELWSSGEKLNFTSREINIQYVPQTRESRLVKIPIVKNDAGDDLMVLSASEKDLYRKIEDDAKKESASKQDEW
jgi:hypothetical protein